MDNLQRIFLILALAVTSWMLVKAWNDDYGHTSTNLATEIASANELSRNGETPANGAPSPTLSATPEDVPQSQEDETPVVEQPETENLISVTTHDLRLSISTKGGDIRALDLLDYPVSIDENAPAIPLLSDSQRLYYVAQSGLIGKNGPDRKARPIYSSSQSEYEITGSEPEEVRLTWSDGELVVSKIYSIPPKGHTIGLRYEIANNGTSEANVQPYLQLARDNSGDISSTGSMGAYSYLGASFSTPEDPYLKVDFEDFSEGFKSTQQGGWMSFQQHYFLASWIPEANTQGSYTTRKLNGRNLASWVGSGYSVAPGETIAINSTFYGGPKIQQDLEALSPGLDLTIDYGILWFIGKPIFSVMTWIQDYVPNWGWTIVILTVLIKLLLYPLSAASYRSMAKMRAVGPEMQRLREQYGDDRQKLSQAMMEFYRKEKINPLGGCLPILLQMPVFISLYWVLLESVEIRQADFLWIQDLSQMDPFYVLPLLMGASMFIQQTLNPTPPDPMQAKIMKFLPVIFTIFFLWFPAGLVLYWLVNNILSIAQQWVITRQVENASKA